MIKIEHVVLASPEQMAFIIEGMRNPMNSWGKSDSHLCSEDSCDICCYKDATFACSSVDINPIDSDYMVGKNDHDLMQRLSNAGTDHRKFMRMMPVYVRITAPLYWWKEFDTYKVGTIANSCSTMHNIQAKKFTLDDFSCEHLNRIGTSSLWDIIDVLNAARSLYLKGGDYKCEHYDPKDKQVWWQMIQLLPSSYNQTRNVMVNYETLANIYKSRKDHKLDEWRDFCKWITELPYSELIVACAQERGLKNEITPDSEYLIRWAKDTGNFLKNAGIKLTQEQINEINNRTWEHLKEASFTFDKEE